MKTKITLIVGLIAGCIGLTRAQFVPIMDDAHLPMNQACEVTTLDGKVVKGALKGGMQMNGKLKSFSVEPEGGGDKMKFKAEEVLAMRAKPSNLQKYMDAASAACSVSKMKDIKNILNTEWIYYETVKMPKSDKSFLMQRLNPGENNNKLKVYQNPQMKTEGPGGFDMTKTSYLVLAEGGNKAITVERKGYAEAMKDIFAGCPDFESGLAGDNNYANFPSHVAFYNYSCK